MEVKCSIITVTYKTPKGKVCTKLFRNEKAISIRGEIISKEICGLPCHVSIEWSSEAYGESVFVEIKWLCGTHPDKKKEPYYQHESDGPFQDYENRCDTEAFSDWLNTNLANMSEVTATT